MICAGLDAGSRTIKAVLYDTDSRRAVARGMVDQGIRQAGLAKELFRSVLKEAGLKRSCVMRVVATGYGRDSIEFADDTITEITCQARGVHSLHPETATVIDIGGQDSKVIRLDGDGAVHDFVMNDRCAAGTGRFIEMVAARLEVGLDALDRLAGKAGRRVAINSTCAVFAESEIVGLLAAREPRANIVAGVRAAIAARVASMAGRNVTAPVLFTGGVALVPGMDKALQSALGLKVRTAAEPRFTCALGAAILAADG